jgi:hypothetical protein
MTTTLMEASMQPDAENEATKINGSVAAEAARLAEAQAQRLAARDQAPTKQIEVTVTPPEPKLIGELRVALYDNQFVKFNVPLQDPDLCLEMMRMVHVALINHARAEGAQRASAAKQPFMKRVFGFGKRPS